MKRLLSLLIFLSVLALAQSGDISDPLLRVLAAKGVITPEEARSIGASATPAERNDRLAVLLRDKGLLSDNELASVTTKKPEPVLVATTSTAGLSLPSAPLQLPRSTPQQTAQPSGAPPAPTSIAGIVPIRLLPIDPVKREGMIPDIRLGGGARLKPFGFIKATAVYDTSSPGGNDFPLPGFLGDTGPDLSPEFHIKARSTRLGTQFEWLDISPKWSVTGRFEADFEGNFSRVNNRNISTIRSSAFQIRSAWGRLDYAASSEWNFHMLFGQDWTPFGSSTLPNLVETTGLGVGYGVLWERAPQFRAGFTRSFGGSRNFKFQPEIALVLPIFGNVPTNLSDQLGFGERQGADSGRPEVQGRLVWQWQLDRASGVAPAQFIISGVQGERTATVLAAAVPTAFRAAFPHGGQVSSDRYGYTVEAQLPTRAFTFLGKYYNGKDLRFYFVGQLFSNFNDTAGLTGATTVPSIDGASNVVFALRNGVPVIAPQRGVRTQGYMANLGFPLSRWFHASPAGRNAGWSAYAHYSYDYAYGRDVRRFAGGRGKSDVGAFNIQYKFNNWMTFLAEESLYRTRAANNSAADIGGLPLLRGIPSREWQDFRSEFGTLFTF
jgi:hypothetical protein